MIEITKSFWLNAGDEIPSLEGISLCDNNLTFNILCTHFDKNALVRNVSEIRSIRCGFEFHMPKINVCFDISVFTAEIASEISALDMTLPEITVILIVNDENIKKDTIISYAHMQHDLALKHKLHVDFYFVIIKDYRLLDLTLMKLLQLKTILATHTDNLSPSASIVLELSPMVIENQNDSFYEDTHFEVDNIIAVLSSCEYFDIDIPDSICGLISMLRQVAICKGISEKLYTLSTQEIQFSNSDYSCYYNLICGASLNCIECRNKLLKNLPINLGVFDDAVRAALSDNGDKSDFRVLVADWDYIV